MPLVGLIFSGRARNRPERHSSANSGLGTTLIVVPFVDTTSATPPAISMTLAPLRLCHCLVGAHRSSSTGSLEHTGNPHCRHPCRSSLWRLIEPVNLVATLCKHCKDSDHGSDDSDNSERASELSHPNRMLMGTELSTIPSAWNQLHPFVVPRYLFELCPLLSRRPSMAPVIGGFSI